MKDCIMDIFQRILQNIYFKNTFFTGFLQTRVLGELPCGKFPLVKLPRGESSLVKFLCGEFPPEYSPEENSFTENSLVFINAFFMHHSLKMKRELVIG